MAWMDIKGAVVADTVYVDGALTAKDISFTLPGLSFLSADVQALGNMSVPLIGLLENMQASITKVGLDMGFSKMNRLVKHTIEFRWVQSVVKSDGSVAQEGCKAFIRTMPASTPDLGVEIGSASEMESTYNVSRMQIYCNGAEVLCVDRLAPTLKINGVDYYKQISSLL